jgi:hypothetical protein
MTEPNHSTAANRLQDLQQENSLKPTMAFEFREALR